jgi:hypothetical protein
VQGAKTLIQLAAADGTLTPSPLEGLRGRATVRGLAAADLDGDGRQDLVVGYLSFEGRVWRTGVDAFLARPDGAWERRTLQNQASNEGIFAVATGDVDGDRRTDVAALTGGGALWLFLGDGRGGFVRDTGDDPMLPGCAGYHLELADLTGDGRAEVMAGFAGEGQGLPGLTTPVATCTSQGALRVWQPVPVR